jgi:hypothetical protein
MLLQSRSNVSSVSDPSQDGNTLLRRLGANRNSEAARFTEQNIRCAKLLLRDPSLRPGSLAHNWATMILKDAGLLDQPKKKPGK